MRVAVLTDVRSPCYTRRNISFVNFCIIWNCNCTNCSAIMVAMLDFTGESALSISVDILAAILDYGTALQHQLQEWFCSPC